MPPKISAQFVCPSPKVSMKKSSLWMSFVREIYLFNTPMDLILKRSMRSNWWESFQNLGAMKIWLYRQELPLELLHATSSCFCLIDRFSLRFIIFDYSLSRNFFNDLTLLHIEIKCFSSLWRRRKRSCWYIWSSWILIRYPLVFSIQEQVNLQVNLF